MIFLSLRIIQILIPTKYHSNFMETNEFLIKITSKSPIDRELELGQDVVVLLKGSVIQRQERDRQDGTMDIVFVVKPVDVQIVNENTN